MQIAILTRDGFHELDSFIAADVMIRMKPYLANGKTLEA